MVLQKTVTIVRISKRGYLGVSLAAVAILVLIHWHHSWPALSSGQVFPDLGDSRKANPLLESLQAATLLCLFGGYFLCLLRWQELRLGLREVWWIGMPQWLLAWAALPANSTDIFGYIGLGRLAWIYGANPYLHTYSEFPDQFSPYVEWNITMPYGPVLLPLFILAGCLSQYSVLVAVFALKWFWLLTHGCNCRLLYQILKSWNLSPVFGLFLFGLNPLLLLEQIANGHNDGVMILFGLMAILALQRNWPGAAVLLALMSALVKLPGIFFFLGMLIYLVRKREWRPVAQSLLGGTVLILLLKGTLFPTKESLISLANTGNYTKNSLHTLMIVLSKEFSFQMGLPLHYETLYVIDRRLFTCLFFAFFLWRIWRIRELPGLVQEVAYLFLGLLIGYATWFFPWYVAWVVPLAAMVESIRLRWAIVAFSWTASALYAFPHHLIEVSPNHMFWATLRIVIVHLIPLVLIVRAISAEHSLKNQT